MSTTDEHRAVPVDDPPPGAVVLDRRADQLADLAGLTADLPEDRSVRWVHYPWRNTTVEVLGPEAFRLLRQDRPVHCYPSGHRYATTVTSGLTMTRRTGPRGFPTALA